MAYLSQNLIDSETLAIRLGTTSEKLAAMVGANRLPFTVVNGQKMFDGAQLARLRTLASQFTGSGVSDAWK